MKSIIEQDELERRCRCLRRWYFSRKDCRTRSIERRKIIAKLDINPDIFYNILRGRTYLSDQNMEVINKVVNRYCIPGWECDIFAK